MVFKIDFIGGKIISWTRTESGVKAETHEHLPRFYIEGDPSKLQRSRAWILDQRGVRDTEFENWRPTLSKQEKKVLRVDVSQGRLKQVVNRLKKKAGRSTFRYYNVGFSPQFRFCLQKEICPVPDLQLSKVELELPRQFIASGDISKLRIDGKEVQGDETEALESLRDYFRVKDPDIMIFNRGEVLELMEEESRERGVDLGMARTGSIQQLAGGNSVTSYGRRQYCAPRYNIPGRILIDRSNSFLLGEATLEGLWDLVERSYRPMQELAWGSIGRVLTSIEVKKAYLEENTLTPWKNWSGEKPKKASTLHKADRGGFIFSPEPGIHEDVYEADFASLFPNIMIEKNISPETVCCDCCENFRVPELDYSICQEREGFIGEVLRPLVDDRQDMKEKLDDIEDVERRREVQGRIDAIKWLLVSCFGYMGHAHASYGAIRCHQAIQAFDRKIMVETKEMFEEAGYRVIHGIIDSIWVQKKEDAENFRKVCGKISKDIGIELEPEHRFDWCAFVPRKSSEADISTLNRYFGKKANGEFKTAGIELEQRSTCRFVKDAQREMIKALDIEFDEEDVIKVLREKEEELESGEVDPGKLVKTRKVSKRLEEYSAENRSKAALKRCCLNGIEMHPGQSVNFVVRDDDAAPMDRLRLDFEAEEYDPEFYKKQLRRAAESILSPLGTDREYVEEELAPGNESLKQLTRPGG
jgi:DNA polymerase I